MTLIKKRIIKVNMIETQNHEIKMKQDTRGSIFSKCVVSLIFGLLPMHIFAESYVQPIIHGKVQTHLEMNLKMLPKPKQVIRGGEDECNGGNFPDQYRYGDFTVLDNGQIREVVMNGSNGIIFHQQRIVDTINQQTFKRKFKAFIYEDETNPNIFSADMAKDGNDSIQFIFKAGKLQRYRLNFDNC